MDAMLKSNKNNAIAHQKQRFTVDRGRVMQYNKVKSKAIQHNPIFYAAAGASGR